MRLLVQGLCCCVVSMSSHAHEITLGAPATIAMHALYHKVKASYPLVDTLKFKMQLRDRPDTFSYYFDPATDSLYSCIGNDDSTVCSGPERAANFSWSDAELSYGRRNELSPIARLFHGPVYFLEGAAPFSQFTTYVYYSGKGKAVKCRKTLTSYNFEVDRDGQHLYFQSEKKDEWTERCEQLYPRQ